MVNILMLSKWHVHAEEYARTVSAQPDAKVTCVWDDDTGRGKKWAADLGVPFEPDLEKALARSDVDAVIVDTPTTSSDILKSVKKRNQSHKSDKFQLIKINEYLCNILCKSLFSLLFLILNFISSICSLKIKKLSSIYLS